MTICKQENCNYEVWNELWWFDCKLFEDFNICCCLFNLPCKIPIMIMWGLCLIPGYKLFYERIEKKKYNKFIIYHI